MAVGTHAQGFNKLCLLEVALLCSLFHSLWEPQMKEHTMAVLGGIRHIKILEMTSTGSHHSAAYICEVEDNPNISGGSVGVWVKLGCGG